MKAHNVVDKNLKAEINRLVRIEVDKIYNLQVPNACRQALAMCLVTLDKQYGFKKQRLERFVESVEDMTKTMTWAGTDAAKAMEYVKDKYGIDLEQLFKVEVDKQ